MNSSSTKQPNDPNADLSATQIIAHRAAKIATRKIWLPSFIYESLPYFYLTAGFAAFFATLYITGWYWVLPHYVLFAAVCIHFGIMLARRRKRARKNLQSAAADSTNHIAPDSQ